MKPRWILVLLAAALAGVLIWLTRPHPETTDSFSEVAGSFERTSEASRQKNEELKKAAFVSKLAERARFAEPVPGDRIILPEVAEIARRLDQPEGPPIADIEILQNLVGNYHRICGALPFGLNHEITRQLCGENSKRYAVLPPDFARINGDGELIDRWGTPYFFHGLTEEILEIRSAGPDRLLWSKDDIGQTSSP